MTKKDFVLSSWRAVWLLPSHSFSHYLSLYLDPELIETPISDFSHTAHLQSYSLFPSFHISLSLSLFIYLSRTQTTHTQTGCFSHIHWHTHSSHFSSTSLSLSLPLSLSFPLSLSLFSDFVPLVMCTTHPRLILCVKLSSTRRWMKKWIVVDRVLYYFCGLT